MFGFKRKKRIYLDYAAATPVRPEVMQVMQPFFSSDFANPSAIHQEGVSARAAVEDARVKVARTLQARSEDVFFTASGTESNNLAIAGVIERHRRAGQSLSDLEVLTTGIEHPSVTEVLRHYKEQGLVVTEIAVGEEGVLDLHDLKSKLSLQTILVSCAYVNSEIGTIAPVRDVARVVQAFNKEHSKKILVHVDAAQAPLWLPCSFAHLGADIMTFDTGKCYGPKGVGILAKRHDVELAPTLFGGGQEQGVRPGTENTPLIVGAARALAIAQNLYAERADRVRAVRDAGIQKLTALPGVVLNGSATERVANNINISIAGVESEFAAVTLDVAGIACSTKSACGSGKGAGSAVVRLITGDDERATTTLRFTLGEDATEADINVVCAVLNQHIEKTRAFTQKLTQG